jgi:hypothetical protein
MLISTFYGLPQIVVKISHSMVDLKGFLQQPQQNLNLALHLQAVQFIVGRWVDRAKMSEH